MHTHGHRGYEVVNRKVTTHFTGPNSFLKYKLLFYFRVVSAPVPWSRLLSRILMTMFLSSVLMCTMSLWVRIIQHRHHSWLCQRRMRIVEIMESWSTDWRLATRMDISRWTPRRGKCLSTRALTSFLSSSSSRWRQETEMVDVDLARLSSTSTWHSRHVTCPCLINKFTRSEWARTRQHFPK